MGITQTSPEIAKRSLVFSLRSLPLPIARGGITRAKHLQRFGHFGQPARMIRVVPFRAG